MQRKAVLAALVALAVLGGCAQRDPNLLVRGMGEFGRAAGDYTLTLKTYDLDAEGRARLATSDDASLRGFVSRTLAPKGYAMKAAGPARYALEAHVLCADTKQASLGLMAEELRLPQAAVGADYREEIHFWLPDQGPSPGQRNKEALDRRDSATQRRPVGSFERTDMLVTGGTPLGGQEPPHCQGRVLLTLTPADGGPKREVFVAREATEDCAAQPGCPLKTCRTALEQSLVGLLEKRF